MPFKGIERSLRSCLRFPITRLVFAQFWIFFYSGRFCRHFRYFKVCPVIVSSLLGANMQTQALFESFQHEECNESCRGVRSGGELSNPPLMQMLGTPLSPAVLWRHLAEFMPSSQPTDGYWESSSSLLATAASAALQGEWTL